MHGRLIRLSSRWLLTWSETAGSVALTKANPVFSCAQDTQQVLITVTVNVHSRIQAYGLRSELTASTRAHLNGRPPQAVKAHFQILSNEKTWRESLLVMVLYCSV